MIFYFKKNIHTHISIRLKNQLKVAWSAYFLKGVLSLQIIQMGRSSDSSRETGAISDSSFEATINKKWIELKDTSFDIGIGSDRSRKSKRNDRGKMHGKMRGPYN